MTTDDTFLNTEHTHTVALSGSLTRRIEQRLPRSDFDSVDEYVEFVLREVLSRVDGPETEQSYDAVDKREIESRLESLGYLE